MFCKAFAAESKVIAAIIAAIIIFALLPTLNISVKASDEINWSGISPTRVYNAKELYQKITDSSAPIKIELQNDIVIEEEIYIKANEKTVLLTSALTAPADQPYAIKYVSDNFEVSDNRVLNIIGDEFFLFLKNIEISGGRSTTYGGGIYFSGYGSELHIQSGTLIVNNAASNNGGGIYAEKASVIISGGEICCNTAGGEGGGIYATNNAAVKITGGAICGNSADYYGGGITVYPLSSLNITSCVFYGNTAGTYYDKFSNFSSSDWSTYEKNISVPKDAWSKYNDGAGNINTFQYGYNNYDISYGTELSNIASNSISAPNSVVILKYAVADIGGVSTANPTGNESDSSNLPARGIPLGGVPYKIYQVAHKDTWNSDAEAVTALDLDAKTIQFANDKTIYHLVHPGGTAYGDDSGVTENSYGYLMFNKLQDGLFLVVEGGSPSVKKPAEPFLINLPMKNPAYIDGDPDVAPYLSKVFVYPKSESVMGEAFDYILPFTGGDGIFAQTIIGVTIICGAGALALRRKRKALQ